MNLVEMKIDKTGFLKKKGLWKMREMKNLPGHYSHWTKEFELIVLNINETYTLESINIKSNLQNQNFFFQLLIDEDAMNIKLKYFLANYVLGHNMS